MREETYSEKSVQVAIEAARKAYGRRRGWEAGKACGGFPSLRRPELCRRQSTFFLHAEAANRYYCDLVQRLQQEAMATEARATRATVQLHAPIGRVWRHTAE